MKKRSKKNVQVFENYDEIQGQLFDNTQFRENKRETQIQISEQKKRNRGKARLSQIKQRLMKAYLRTLPLAIERNKNTRNIKHESMKQAIKKFIRFENTHTRKKNFSLQSIQAQIKVFFWSFIVNLQNYSFHQLSHLDETQLMNHHNQDITEQNVDFVIKQYSDQIQEQSKIQRNYYKQVNSGNRIYQQRLYDVLQLRKSQDKMQEQQSYFIRVNNKTRKSSRNNIYMASITLLTLFCFMICLGSSTKQESQSSKRLCLQQNNNYGHNESSDTLVPLSNYSKQHVQYGINTSCTPRLGENYIIERSSNNIILLSVLIYLILLVICICITGLLYLEKIQKNLSQQAHKKYPSKSVIFQ